MDNQDKIFDKIKAASKNAEEKDFLAMEKVWSRLEERLDKKEDKKTISLWKKIAVAASLLLVLSLGFQFLKTDQITTIPNTDKIVTTQSKKSPVENSTLEGNEIKVSENYQVVPKAEVEKILNDQINQKETLALHELKTIADQNSYENSAVVVSEETQSAPASTAVDYSDNHDSEPILQNKAFSSPYKTKSIQGESYTSTQAEKERILAKKSTPLLIMNGKAIAHTKDDKRDKMMQRELPNLSPENVESLVVLDEPLYIIDGIYYSENDLFGSNPTSPYAPLNKQEIKIITILQDLEATSKYGDKGKKGVVLITTKTGKPALQK